ALRHDPTRFNPPEGETARGVHERVTAAVNRLVAENPDREIAIVSHGFALLCYLGCLDIPFEEMESDIVSNCSITRIDYAPDGSHRLIFRNKVDHIPPELQFRSKFWEKERKSES
ncbi:MAG: histidine phosphatase family protein, partial [Butyricicoccaceae bacterium]